MIGRHQWKGKRVNFRSGFAIKKRGGWNINQILGCNKLWFRPLLAFFFLMRGHSSQIPFDLDQWRKNQICCEVCHHGSGVDFQLENKMFSRTILGKPFPDANSFLFWRIQASGLTGWIELGFDLDPCNNKQKLNSQSHRAGELLTLPNDVDVALGLHPWCLMEVTASLQKISYVIGKGFTISPNQKWQVSPARLTGRFGPPPKPHRSRLWTMKCFKSWVQSRGCFKSRPDENAPRWIQKTTGILMPQKPEGLVLGHLPSG